MPSSKTMITKSVFNDTFCVFTLALIGTFLKFTPKKNLVITKRKPGCNTHICQYYSHLESYIILMRKHSTRTDDQTKG